MANNTTKPMFIIAIPRLPTIELPRQKRRRFIKCRQLARVNAVLVTRFAFHDIEESLYHPHRHSQKHAPLFCPANSANSLISTFYPSPQPFPPQTAYALLFTPLLHHPTLEFFIYYLWFINFIVLRFFRLLPLLFSNTLYGWCLPRNA